MVQSETSLTRSAALVAWLAPLLATAAVAGPTASAAAAADRRPNILLMELYDLQEDPCEMRNLADDPRYADVLARLRAELLRWRQKTADPLLDRANLARLTGEHDALGDPWDMSYRRDPRFRWRYPDYLAPPGRAGRSVHRGGNARQATALARPCTGEPTRPR